MKIQFTVTARGTWNGGDAVMIQFTVTGSVFVPDDHFVERDPQRLAHAIKRVLENCVRTKIDWKDYTKDITATVTATPFIPNEA